MEIVKEELLTGKAQRGKNKLLVRIDEDDINIIYEAVNTLDQKGAFDKDDYVFIDRLNHVKDVTYKMWFTLHPS
jgi:hypothetical protein